jgi:hypothetical protein
VESHISKNERDMGHPSLVVGREFGAADRVQIV